MSIASTVPTATLGFVAEICRNKNPLVEDAVVMLPNNMEVDGVVFGQGVWGLSVLRDKYSRETGKVTAEKASKSRMSLIPFQPLRVVADVLAWGNEKYKNGRMGWVSAKGAPDCFKDALVRHVGDYVDGKIVDEDSKLPALGHIIANALFLLWFELNQKKQ